MRPRPERNLVLGGMMEAPMIMIIRIIISSPIISNSTMMIDGDLCTIRTRHNIRGRV